MAETSSPHPVAGGVHPRRVRDLYWIAAAGAVLNMRRGLHFNSGAGTLWVDPYWVGFYLNSYGDGFRRRAFVGTIFRHLFHAGVPIVFLNVLGLLVLAACFVLFFRALGKLAADHANERMDLMVFALAASAVTACFYETMGDLLQIDLLLFCGINLLATRRLRSESARLLVAVAITVLAFFIHEASLFFFVPALPFILKARPRPRDFAVPVLLYVALLALSTHWASRIGHSGYSARLYPSGRQFAYPEATPSFREELAIEHHAYFGPQAPRMLFWGQLIRLPALLLGYLGALAIILPRRFFQRMLLVLGCIFVFSVPLWIVAVDWGRFLTYGLFVAVMVTSFWIKEGSFADTAVPARLQRIAARLQTLARNPLLLFGVAFVLMTSAEFPATHVGAMSDMDSQSFFILIAVAIVAWFARKMPAVPDAA